MSDGTDTEELTLEGIGRLAVNWYGARRDFKAASDAYYAPITSRDQLTARGKAREDLRTAKKELKRAKRKLKWALRTDFDEGIL